MYYISWVYPYPLNHYTGGQFRKTLEAAQKLASQMQAMNCYVTIRQNGKTVQL